MHSGSSHPDVRWQRQPIKSKVARTGDVKAKRKRKRDKGERKIT